MRSWLLFLLLFILGGCASQGPIVSVQRRSDADLMQYRSFAFFSPLGTDKAEYASLRSQYLKKETRAALEARGYRYTVDNPELFVNFISEVRERSYPSTTLFGGFGRRRFGFGIGYEWPREVMTYQEEELTVDVIDAKTKEVLWEAKATDRIWEDNQKDLENTVRIAVDKIFSQLP
ncbi:MAG: DUF4136 domain-containing protein [Zoogloeaceae bacterium]|jgi:hypothetical protein|nr:DUF4136 domain-containing protein [Zoogloeaceae bacterium]